MSEEDKLGEATAVAVKTRSLLESRGWCLWWCNNFEGQVICIIDEHRPGRYPRKYPAFTVSELEELHKGGWVSVQHLTLVLEAKRLEQAYIVGVGHDKG